MIYDKILLTWLTRIKPTFAQFAPPGIQDPGSRDATEIIPNAGKIIGQLPGTETQTNAPSLYQVAGNILTVLISHLIGILGFLAVLMLIYAGFLWVTSAANPDNIKKAKTVIMYAAIGLLLAGFSYAIVRVVTGISMQSTI